MEVEPQETVAVLGRPEDSTPPEDRDLKHNGSYRVGISSIETLLPEEWLDDRVINTFLGAICLTRPGQYVAIDCTSLGLLTSLHELDRGTGPTPAEVDEHCNPLRCLAATVTGNRGLVFMPFCLEGHWILAVADLATWSIRVYDSLVSGDINTGNVDPSTLVMQILPYVKDTLRFCRYEDGWAVEHKLLPIERNITECGVYLCLMALREAHGRQFGLSGYVTPFFDGNGVMSPYYLDACYWTAGRKIILEVCEPFFRSTSDDILQRFQRAKSAIDERLREDFYNVRYPEFLPQWPSYFDARRWTLLRIMDDLFNVIQWIDSLGSTQYLRYNMDVQRRAREVVLTPRGEALRDGIVKDATRYAWHDFEALQDLKKVLSDVCDSLIHEDYIALYRLAMDAREPTGQTPLITGPGSTSSPDII